MAAPPPPTPRRVSIRKATPEDGPAILACLQTAFKPYRRAYTLDGFADTVLTPETLARRFESMTIFVATTADDEVVGTLACGVVGGGEGHLRGMAVLPAWQGRGVASALLTTGEQHLKASTCSRVSLDTTEPLRRAAAFYACHGYTASGKVSDFFGMRLIEYVKVFAAID